jgi:polysaccharide transporter, PST family
MKFIKATFWSGLSVGVRSAGSLAINKVIAYFFEPAGVALYAHFQNFLAIFLSIPSDGLNRGMIKYLADKDISLAHYRKIFSAGLVLNFIYFLLAMGGMLIFKDKLIHLFAGTMLPLVWLPLILTAVFLQLFNFFFLNIILAAQRIRTYVVLSIVASITLFVSVAFFAWKGDFTLTLLAVAFGPALFFFVTIYLAVRYKDLKFISKDIFKDLGSYRNLGQFILMGASIMVFGNLVDFLIRQYVINGYGLDQTGLWQAVVKLSDSYSAAFVAVLGMVYYPKLSELINHHEELKKYVRSVLLICIPFIFSGLLVVYYFKEEFLVIFFQSKFEQAAYLMDFQLVGDVFKLTSLILGYLIVVQARTSLFIISQGVSALVSVALMYVCSSQWGLEGLPMAHAIRYTLYFTFLVLLYKKIVFR